MPSTARHPANPVPRWRTLVRGPAGSRSSFLALASPIEHLRHDALLRPHGPAPAADAWWPRPCSLMAAPDHAGAARSRRPRARRRWILPVLHSRPVRRPVGAAGRRGWSSRSSCGASHFSPLFDAALEDEAAAPVWSTPCSRRRAAVLVAGRRRRSEPARLGRTQRGSGYLARACRSSSFLGLVIFSARAVLYPHYATLSATGACRRSRTRRGPAAIMWAVRRPRVPHRDHRRGRRLVAPRGPGGQARRRASRA